MPIAKKIAGPKPRPKPKVRLSHLKLRKFIIRWMQQRGASIIGLNWMVLEWGELQSSIAFMLKILHLAGNLYTGAICGVFDKYEVRPIAISMEENYKEEEQYKEELPLSLASQMPSKVSKLSCQ